MLFNVQDYGARPNGPLCTRQLQKAIDDCFRSGGGEVVVPTGVYLTGGLRLRTGVTLHLLENAVLRGSTDPEDYTEYLTDELEPIDEQERAHHAPNVVIGARISDCIRPYSRWNNAILRAVRARNVAIIGECGSEIDGQNCFDPEGEEGFRGPHAINMWYCDGITLRGYTVRDSANWAHAIQNSRHIRVEGITVLGGHDGFDIRSCDDVRIERSVFRTGDDCIAGFDNIDVTVRECCFESSCSIFRFGGADVLIEDCRGIPPTEYGHRLTLTDEEKRRRAPTTDACRRNCLNVFLYYCDNRAQLRRTPGNIVVRRSYFEGADAVMRLPFGVQWCTNRSLADITFEACTFVGIREPMLLSAPTEEPLTLRMLDCTLSAADAGGTLPLLSGTNVKDVVLERVKLYGFSADEIDAQPRPKITIK